MITQQHTSQAGVDLIAHSEGCYLYAYKCPAGIPTIGYGHTSAAGGLKVTPGLTITREQAIELLHHDLQKFERAVSRLVKVPLNQNQFDALVSFMFNVGEGNFAKSTLLKKLNKGDYNSVMKELPRWRRSKGKVLPGLVKRRAAEANLWAGLHHGLTEHTGTIAQSVDKPTTQTKQLTATHSGAALSGGILSGGIPWHSLANIHVNWHHAGIALLAVGIFFAGMAVDHYLLSRNREPADELL